MNSKHSIFIVFFLALLILVIIFSQDILDFFLAIAEKISDFSEEHPNLSPLIIALMFLCASALFIPPSSTAAAFSGYLLGFRMGLLISFLAIVFGCSLVYFLSRTFLNKHIHKRLKGNKKIAALHSLIEKDAVKVAFACRLCPLFPFTFTNYVLSISEISYKLYVLVTAIAITPYILIWNYIGDSMVSLVDVVEGSGADEDSSLMNWVFIAISLCVTIILSYDLGRRFKILLKEEMEKNDSEQEADDIQA